MKPNRHQFTETCSYDEHSLPMLELGGYLEMKRGELCLRLADTVVAQSQAQYQVTRTWMRPVETPFDTNFYPIKSSPSMA